VKYPWCSGSGYALLKLMFWLSDLILSGFLDAFYFLSLNMRGDLACVCLDRMMFYNYIMHAINKEPTQLNNMYYVK
jgi:hypothetical protein